MLNRYELQVVSTHVAAILVMTNRHVESGMSLYDARKKAIDDHAFYTIPSHLRSFVNSLAYDISVYDLDRRAINGQRLAVYEKIKDSINDTALNRFLWKWFGILW